MRYVWMPATSSTESNATARIALRAPLDVGAPTGDSVRRSLRSVAFDSVMLRSFPVAVRLTWAGCPLPSRRGDDPLVAGARSTQCGDHLRRPLLPGGVRGARRRLEAAARAAGPGMARRRR